MVTFKLIGILPFNLTPYWDYIYKITTRIATPEKTKAG